MPTTGKSPGTAAHFFHRMYSLPVEQFFGLGSVCPECRQITISARTDLVRQMNARYLLKSLDQFQHRYTVTSSQIEGFNSLMVLCVGQCCQMPYSQIDYMQIVPFTGTIFGIIVAAKDRQLFKLTGCTRPI